jgi:hypothetical protein
MCHRVSPCAKLVIICNKVFKVGAMAMVVAATFEGEVTHKPVGPQLSGIPLAPPDLPFHTQAIVNTSCVIWIGEESFLFYKQSKNNWNIG